MNIIAKGYELTTALTNLVIFVVSIYALLNVKDKKWKIFFFLMTINSLLGTIVHGIVLNNIIKSIIWTFLSILFVFTVNMILSIFQKIKIKNYMYLSISVSIIIIVLYYLKMNFLLAYTFYVLMIIILSFYYIIKSSINKKKYFVMGYVIQVIGGLFLVNKVCFKDLNHNGIYHLFMALTLIFFYFGSKDNKS